MFAEADGVGRSRLVELTEHHITGRRRVPAVDDGAEVASMPQRTKAGPVNAEQAYGTWLSRNSP
ncbi:hypothetical protein RGQ21_00760 [Kitasatospora aureofaciens]|nr:hypothetical protein RGQ21_00760 [Kitasatospora aureofaciens]